MKATSFFNSHIFVATNHKKSQAAADPFNRILQVTVGEIEIDSDSLGTFSGEVERPGSMLDALRGKIKLARFRSNERFIVASEGSFNSADGYGIYTQGVEMLLLHDSLTGAEIIEQHISMNTNYACELIRDPSALELFQKKISFGAHGLVLYPEGVPLKGVVHKGITSTERASEAFEACRSLSPSGRVMAISDMRAHFNPTRMQEIKRCCELLALRLASPCPECRNGGFGLTGTVPGLPCIECGLPTPRAKGEKHSCPFCHASRENPRSDGKATAEPWECQWCNP